MNKFVQIYNNQFISGMGPRLIQTFESSLGKEFIDNDKRPQFTQLNINLHHPELIPSLVTVSLEILKEYKDYLGKVTDYLPSKVAMEEFRIKKYRGGRGDQFAPHVDVGDLTSCKRYLALLFYLNDDFTGGRTVFEHADRTCDIIVPKRGNVIIFPPTWQYPHWGEPVDHGNKYIMSTYFNYV